MSIVVSNSEIETFQRCEMKFYFQVVLGVRPEILPEPLRVGLFGHKLFEWYWEIWLQGERDLEKIEQEVINRGTEQLARSGDAVCFKAIRPAIAFARHMLERMHIEPYLVEQRYIFPLMENLHFGMTPDLIGRIVGGTFKGQFTVLDWKFTGQYWNAEEVEMFQQIPKYIRFLNTFDFKGEEIRRGLLVMLNTRPSSKSNDLFRTEWLSPNKEKLQRIAVENFDLAVEVAQRKMLPMADQYDAARRTVNHYECKLCPYAKDVCPNSFSGRDISKTLRVNYVENDYGYEAPNATA